jgi:putative acetyltransferase
VIIRPERAGEEQAIGVLMTRAFADSLHASGNEAEIVERLRRDGDLEASFVAADGDRIVFCGGAPRGVVSYPPAFG